MKSSEKKYESIVNDCNAKSKYMWRLVHNQIQSQTNSICIPKKIIQFWNEENAIPEDVFNCMKSWKRFEGKEIEYLLFNEISARKYILQNYVLRYVDAYDRCIHPAMRADYFRLCYTFMEGGMYVDADDVCLVDNIEPLFCGNLLKVQALCYDTDKNEMVNANMAFFEEYKSNRIYYVNNNPLIVRPKHPILKCALERATRLLLDDSLEKKDIQSITGPGNLTDSFVWGTLQSNISHVDYEIFVDWEQTAISKWPLEYRHDKRNWRNWDGSCM